MQETTGSIPGLGRSLEKEMATHSTTFAWRITWTVELGRLQSMGSQRVRHDWAPDCILIRCYVANTWDVLFSHTGDTWKAKITSTSYFLKKKKKNNKTLLTCYLLKLLNKDIWPIHLSAGHTAVLKCYILLRFTCLKALGKGFVLFSL